MLHVYVVIDGDGRVQSVNSSVDGAAMFAFGWGEGTLDGDASWTLEGVERVLTGQPSVTIDYGETGTLSIQRHGVFA